MAEASEFERNQRIAAMSSGENHRAFEVIGWRVPENVATALVVDLHRQGLVVVDKEAWDAADNLVKAVVRVIPEREED